MEDREERRDAAVEAAEHNAEEVAVPEATADDSAVNTDTPDGADQAAQEATELQSVGGGDTSKISPDDKPDADATDQVSVDNSEGVRSYTQPEAVELTAEQIRDQRNSRLRTDSLDYLNQGVEGMREYGANL